MGNVSWTNDQYIIYIALANCKYNLLLAYIMHGESSEVPEVNKVSIVVALDTKTMQRFKGHAV